MPSSATRASVESERAFATTSAAMSPRSRAMRATELPISPTPISVSRRNSFSAMALLRHEGIQRVGEQRAFLGGADGHAQTVRQAVAAHAAHDQPAPAQEGI